MANQISSKIRDIKVDLTFALGGLKNHELYFNILGGDGVATGKIAELIDRDFGSFDNFKKDLKATGIAARGWAWLGIDSETGKLFNYIGDAQNSYPDLGASRRCSDSMFTSMPTMPTSSRPAPGTSMNFCARRLRGSQRVVAEVVN